MGLQVSGKTNSQTITFSGSGVTLKEVFAAVRAQTDFGIIYNKSWLGSTKPVTINAVNKPLSDFLREAFVSQPLEFSIEGKTVIVKKKSFSIIGEISRGAGVPPVTGVVRGPDGQPIAGVNVMVKGTNKGSCDGCINGRFSIEADQGKTLSGLEYWI